MSRNIFTILLGRWNLMGNLDELIINTGQNYNKQTLKINTTCNRNF